MSDEAYIDSVVRHGRLIVQTQHGIIEYAEGMAQVLAEAGRASNKALGDSPEYAVRRWSDVILNRALEILREEKCAAPRESRKRKSISILSG